MFIHKDCRIFIEKLNEFSNFNGCQFGFWIDSNVQKTFKESPISKFGDAKQGLKTGDNTYFIKTWFEVSKLKLNAKWFPVETGGNFRKWYGNGINVLNDFEIAAGTDGGILICNFSKLISFENNSTDNIATNIPTNKP